MNCAIGLDFGTLSVRALLADVAGGAEVAAFEYAYPHAVMDRNLPGSSRPLEIGTALQDPSDYEESMIAVLKKAAEKLKEGGHKLVGIGVSFTACTVLPLGAKLRPLCEEDAFSGNPHSFVKLWKHHAAQAQADRINAAALQRKETFLARYGGSSSSEWMFAKILETLEKAPDVYAHAKTFAEAGDWIVCLLTGTLQRNACAAGYKAFWDPDKGYPDPDFFAALNPAFRNVVSEKLSEKVIAPGSHAGCLCRSMAERTGLPEGTPVAAACIDAHCSVPAVGIARKNALLMIMGTSTCHMLTSDKEVLLPGISGVIRDGILPGSYGYEAGQAAVGDIFDWFVSRMSPSACMREAERKGVGAFALMDEKMAALRPGESGLLALDWFNGNRSLLVDSDLSGMLLGMTLVTRPEEIYRSLVEATAFGTKLILDVMQENGITPEAIYACGGLSHKSPAVMQIYADILGTETRASASTQASALGAAMYGATAAGKEGGGFAHIGDAVAAMAAGCPTVYYPDEGSHRIYLRLFAEYKRLHDFFGRGGCRTMKALREIKENA